MSEENSKNKDPMYYSARNILAKLGRIISDTSLTREEWKKSLDEVYFMIEENKKLDGRKLFKNVLMKLQYARSKAEGDEEWKTRAKLYHASKFFDEILQKMEKYMIKEQKEFFEKHPELLPVKTDDDQKDLDPKWTQFRDYYIKKLYNELKSNMDEEWKRQAMVQYARRKFNEIYRKAGDLIEKEEEAVQFYRTLPKKYKKFLKILPKR